MVTSRYSLVGQMQGVALVFSIGAEEQSLAVLSRFLRIELPSIMRVAENKGLINTATFVRQEMRDFIAQGGDNWPLRAAFSNEYSSRLDNRSPVFRRKSKRDLDNGLMFLLTFFNWRIFDETQGKSVVMDFRETKNPDMNRLIKQIQTGAKITVTDAMRKAFSYTDFPLKKETKTIDIPARPIGEPLFLRTNSKYLKKFTEAFSVHMKGKLIDEKR